VLKHVGIGQQTIFIIFGVGYRNMVVLSGKCFYGRQAVPPGGEKKVLPITLRFSPDAGAEVSLNTFRVSDASDLQVRGETFGKFAGYAAMPCSYNHLRSIVVNLTH